MAEVPARLPYFTLGSRAAASQKMRQASRARCCIFSIRLAFSLSFCALLRFDFFLGYKVFAVLGAERINLYAKTNWELFSKQNYFDKSGVFVSIMLSIPMLTLAMIVLVRRLHFGVIFFLNSTERTG